MSNNTRILRAAFAPASEARAVDSLWGSRGRDGAGRGADRDDARGHAAEPIPTPIRKLVQDERLDDMRFLVAQETIRWNEGSEEYCLRCVDLAQRDIVITGCQGGDESAMIRDIASLLGFQGKSIFV